MRPITKLGLAALLALGPALPAAGLAQPVRAGGEGAERPARPDRPDVEAMRGAMRERRGANGERPADRLRDRPDRPPERQRPGAGDPAQRRLVEQRIRERFGDVVRRQLQLDDAQFRRLRETNREFEGRRRDLVLRERAARGTIRDELARGDGADDGRVNAQMQELLKLQRERLQIAEQEDAQLGEFLSPAQRAKYFGLQEQLRRRVEEMRRRAMAGDQPPPDDGSDRN
ncbi:MAG: hypothetical protein ACK53A_15040 [Gemmatimonadota bacterium]|jgi:hypothetical protein|nr:hypothetical protein [Gemmatimonadota bacterium]